MFIFARVYIIHSISYISETKRFKWKDTLKNESMYPFSVF